MANMRLWLLWLVAFAFCSPPLAFSQPVLPLLGGTGCSAPTTVSGLTAYAVDGALCQVQDGSDSSDCSSGGGSAVVLCCYDGASWSACGGSGGGGGGSGDITSVGTCTNADCFAQTGGSGTTLYWEGSTADGNELALTYGGDPGSDLTLTLPGETGTLCSTGSVCSGYASSLHTHTIGSTSATGWFTGSDGANNLYFEGPTANGFEGELIGADFSADRTITIPNETGTICTTGSVCSGYGDLDGPSSATDGAVVAFDDTTGKLVQNTECTMSDDDSDTVLDAIHCPEGFSADAQGCDTNSDCNYVAIHENASGDADPTCANSGVTDKFLLLPQGDNTVDLCLSTTTIGQIAQRQYDGGCINVPAPTSDQEFYTVWIAPAAFTITSIYCEMSGGTSVAADFEIDDGSPTGVNGSNITCDASETDSSLAGDTSMASGDKLDVDLGTVTGSVTQFSICISGYYDY